MKILHVDITFFSSFPHLWNDGFILLEQDRRNSQILDIDLI